ncbi:zinc-alpha-2-glycoprotein-like [Phascolarctos cinereus]|uniref:Zinc-alpha-2-glycoprotein-like n=2 Tax=Phascolarctos cinereus TaxID=38626 RepID=A0A6P5LC67_PHACI|nr:zinc-alpha-2-glycoprotein-like [Phascolarctos cinereus]XP_020855896.1 zinc-alpha-2-glycoprotein-like [Phascolarctos cinereus]
MMGPLITVFFLLLFSGTTVLGQKPHSAPKPGKQCDSLVYKDKAQSKGTPFFTNKAYFNEKLIYQYDSNSQEAVPEPGWENADDWKQEGQFQKRRQGFAMEYLRDIMAYHKDVTGLHVFSGDYGCEVCKNGVTNGFWRYDYDDRPLVEFDKEIPAFITKDPAGDIIKKKWEAEGSVIQAKEYLEKTCIENLKKYRDYKKAN